uniref:Cysteine synthase n=1 Tax=Parastrongyloides trichosuri TaxID=131310 RepID=A0A0N4ZI55_PARTI
MENNNCIYNSIDCVIGNTPMVYLNKITKHLDAKIAVKLEYFSPSCSVKDRASIAMIDQYERDGIIIPGKSILIEATSGNAGIGLAFVSAVRNYKLILVMPDSVSLERKCLVKAYGAELILTEASKGMKGVFERVEEIKKSVPNVVDVNQFGNQSNPLVHYQTTGPEIYRQCEGNIDMACFGVGTGGTCTGISKYLKEKNRKIKVFAVEPYESSILSGMDVGSHKIQGIGIGMVPRNLDLTYVDDIIRVKSNDAIEMSRRLAKEEGILCGISSGANVCAAIQLACKEENSGKLIVTTVASFGERYLSTELFSDIKNESSSMTFTTIEEDIERFKNIF